MAETQTTAFSDSRPSATSQKPSRLFGKTLAMAFLSHFPNFTIFAAWTAQTLANPSRSSRTGRAKQQQTARMTTQISRTSDSRRPSQEYDKQQRPRYSPSAISRRRHTNMRQEVRPKPATIQRPGSSSSSRTDGDNDTHSATKDRTTPSQEHRFPLRLPPRATPWTLREKKRQFRS